MASETPMVDTLLSQLGECGYQVVERLPDGAVMEHEYGVDDYRRFVLRVEEASYAGWVRQLDEHYRAQGAAFADAEEVVWFTVRQIESHTQADHRAPITEMWLSPTENGRMTWQVTGGEPVEVVWDSGVPGDDCGWCAYPPDPRTEQR